MSPAEHRKDARKRLLHELRDDVAYFEKRTSMDYHDDRHEVFDAVLRMIDDKLWSLFPHGRTDD